MSQQATLQRTLEMLMLLNDSFGKTTEELAERFEVSKRTIYRYIETMKESGFVIDSENGYHKINREDSMHDLSNLLHFSEEEAFILSNAIHEVEGDNDFKSKLAQKLYSLYDFDRVSRAITRKEDSENILALLKGIKSQRQVILKNYHSANSKTIRDRKVEPIDFTYHYSSLWAFDVEDKQTKLFRTSRYSKVVITDEPFKYKRQHKKGGIDIFRTAGFETIKIQLKLTMRAYTLLIEEYPLAGKYIQKLSIGEYLLDTKICSFEGIGRFIMGLPGEVVIMGPNKLKEFVRERVKTFL